MQNECDEHISIGCCRQCKEDIYADEEECYELTESGALYCAACCRAREPWDIHIDQLDKAYGNKCDRQYEEWLDSQLAGGG